MSKKVVKKSSGENTTVEKLEERAAPSGIEWGGIAGSGYKQSRIGTYRTYKHTDTETTVTMQIWYWAGYAIDDTNNNFRYGWGTSANVNIGKKNIHTQNGGYPEANKIFIAEYSKKYTKTDKVQTGKFSTAFDNIEYGGGTGWRVSDFSIPALAKYTISYNANGGSGAPGTQYVLFGRTITLSSTKPTKAGAEFSHWNTNSLGTGTRYNPGQSYTVNSSNKGNITLYAIWNTNDYTITYDANGGANAPSSQTKKHGTDIILSSQKPTRQNYNFLGWASSSTSSIPIYQPGDTYNANASITLYAVWELGYTAPRITELTADRCNVNEAPDEEGTYAKVSFKWEADLYVNLIKIEWKSATNSYWESTQVDSSSNTISQKIGGNLDTETEYNVRVTVQDSNGKSQAETEISSIAFELDFLYKGGGVSIGAPAKDTGFNVHYDTTFEKPVRLKQPLVAYPDTYVDIGDINQPIGCGYFSDVYINGKSHIKNTLLWSGGHFMTTDQTATLSEPISKQAHGIILVFTPYVDNATKTYDRNTFYIPKELIAMHNGQSMLFTPTGSMPGNIVANKCLFIFDNKITGHSQNAFAGQVSGSNIYIQNNKFVLQYVIGI